MSKPINEADDVTTALLNQVAERVHAARKAKHFSRRELSELTGISPRYLVRLENGESNISIALLQRVSIALDRPIEWFVGTDDSIAEDIARLVMRYRTADAATRASVLSVLDPQQLRDNKAQRLCLIGLRGAGKSTLGARLGKDLGVPFIELNQEIERSAGMPVAEVIAMYGQEGYRKLEADTLKHIFESRQRLVLAVAGGVVEEANTFDALLSHFHTVWLQADATEHMERVRAQGDLRPMANNPQALDQLRDILQTRESRYAQAELHLNTSGQSIDASLSELSTLIASHHIFSATDR